MVQTIILQTWEKYPTNPAREKFYTELLFFLVDQKNKYGLDYEFNNKQPINNTVADETNEED